MAAAAAATSHLGFHSHLPTRRPYAASRTTTIVAMSRPDGRGNFLLKAAWYGSELLGITASLFRSAPARGSEPSEEVVASGVVLYDRAAVAEVIKGDFQRSYFVTGNLTLNAYEEDCEFADPAGSFRGLSRFKRNCTNFGSLLVKCNMKLTKWEDFEDKGIGHWRFSCVMSFPWRPILSGSHCCFQLLVTRNIILILSPERLIGM